MNERKSGRSGGMNVGSASIVMVFAVLALTVFAVLALVTARSELSLAKKTSQSVSDYYAADCIAAQRFNEYLKSGLPDGVESYSFTVPVDSRQELCVRLVADAEDGLRVAEWRVCETGSWQADDTIDVWDGE